MKKLFTFELPPELNNRLTALSYKRTGETSNRITKAMILREALTIYLNNVEKGNGVENA